MAELPLPYYRLVDLPEQHEPSAAAGLTQSEAGRETAPILNVSDIDSATSGRLVTRSEDGALPAIDQRIAHASTPQEAAQWLAVRGGILSQESQRADQAHVLWGQKLSLVAKVGLSFIALPLGGILTATGFVVPGLLCLGAGLTPLAPRLVERMLTANGKGNVDDEA